MKKITQILSLILAVTIGFSASSVNAQASGKGAGFIGTITSMNADAHSIMLMNEAGEEMMVMVDGNTVIVDETGNAMKMTDLGKSIKVRITGGGKTPASKIEIMK